MAYPVITFIIPRCNCCGKELNKENWNGWIENSETPFGVPITVPVCNECILFDDGSEKHGAY